MNWRGIKGFADFISLKKYNGLQFYCSPLIFKGIKGDKEFKGIKEFLPLITLPTYNHY